MKIYAKPTFKEARLRMGFSVVSFADKMNISKQAVSGLESRKNGIRPEKAKEALEVLKVDFDEVFEFVERKQSN